MEILYAVLVTWWRLKTSFINIYFIISHMTFNSNFCLSGMESNQLTASLGHRQYFTWLIVMSCLMATVS